MPKDAPLPEAVARGLATVRARLGLVRDDVSDRRARAESLAADLLSLRRAVERGVLA